LAGFTRRFLRDGFNAYIALSPVTGLCCHRRLRKLPLADLTPASGRQDHTTSPYASAPFVRTNALTLPRPSHPASNVRDDREAPLLWMRDGVNVRRVGVVSQGALPAAD
jgi:hypothetical protein